MPLRSIRLGNPGGVRHPPRDSPLETFTAAAMLVASLAGEEFVTEANVLIELTLFRRDRTTRCLAVAVSRSVCPPFGTHCPGAVGLGLRRLSGRTAASLKLGTSKDTVHVATRRPVLDP